MRLILYRILPISCFERHSSVVTTIKRTTTYEHFMPAIRLHMCHRDNDPLASIRDMSGCTYATEMSISFKHSIPDAREREPFDSC